MVGAIAGGQEQQIIVDGKLTPDYARVQGIFIGTVAAFTLFMTIIGPECVILFISNLSADLIGLKTSRFAL
jgi:hypothetical protein